MPETTTPVLRRAALHAIDPVTVYLLCTLRQDVFTLEQHATDADLDGRELEDGTVLMWLEMPQTAGPARPIAHLRVLEGPGEAVRIGRIAVDADHRRGGHGKRLVLAALDLARELHPEWPVEIDAQAYLEDWYVRMGFETVGGLFLEAGIEHVAMVLRRR